MSDDRAGITVPRNVYAAVTDALQRAVVDRGASKATRTAAFSALLPGALRSSERYSKKFCGPWNRGLRGGFSRHGHAPRPSPPQTPLDARVFKRGHLPPQRRWVPSILHAG